MNADAERCRAGDALRKWQFRAGTTRTVASAGSFSRRSSTKDREMNQSQTIDKEDSDALLEEFQNFIRQDRTWMTRAACRGLHPNLFHPTVSDMGTQKQALAVCNGEQRKVMNRKTRSIELIGPPPCPVKEECFEYIMSMTQTQDVGGVYAGMSHKTRRLLRRTRNAETP